MSSLPIPPEETAPEEVAPEETLRRHGRSFSFARRFMGAPAGGDAARLYRFCRYLDDLVDESPHKSAAAEQLDQVAEALRAGESDNRAVRDFLDLARSYRLDPEVAQELIKGLRTDLQTVGFATRAELLRYAYRVAGTVGLMMCPVLGVRTGTAQAHAIDLGIAMQLTNIARDVITDARMGRRYIPAEMGLDWEPGQIAGLQGAGTRELKVPVRNILDLADLYYRSGEDGLGHIPLRNRMAIAAASRIYREIGTLIREQDFAGLDRRVRTAPERKMRMALKTGPVLLRRADSVPHDPALHADIRGLPGTDGPAGL